MKRVNCIAAMDCKRGIGKGNKLPWHLPQEYKHFVRITTKCESKGKCNAVIMGRKTWESLPVKYRPLQRRLNVVLSKTTTQEDYPEEVVVAKSLKGAVEKLSKEPYSEIVESLFVVGGTSVYKEAMESEFCDRTYLTKINAEYECDTFFPEFDDNKFKEIYVDNVDKKPQEEKDITYTFHVYANVFLQDEKAVKENGHDEVVADEKETDEQHEEEEEKPAEKDN